MRGVKRVKRSNRLACAARRGGARAAARRERKLRTVTASRLRCSSSMPRHPSLSCSTAEAQHELLVPSPTIFASCSFPSARRESVVGSS